MYGLMTAEMPELARALVAERRRECDRYHLGRLAARLARAARA